MADAPRRKRTPIVRIGIDLDIIITEDGPLLPEGFDAFIAAQREADRELYLVGCFGDEVMADLEALGVFRTVSDGGLGFDRPDLFLGDGAARQKTIKQLRLSHYIAADSEVFSDRTFSKRAQPILFSYEISRDHPTFADWESVANFLIWNRGVRKLSRSNRLRGFEPIKEHGNNFLYELHTQHDETYVLKRFFEKGSGDHDRLRTEVKSLEALADAGVGQIPGALWTDKKDWVLFDFVPGKSPEKVGNKDVNALTRWLLALDDKSAALRNKRLPPAHDARLSLRSYLDGINRLWNPVLEAAQRKGPQSVMLFMMTDLEQLRQDNINHFYLWCKREKWDLDKPLARKEQIFSPGDFGFHNTLRHRETLTFLDFEHAGWDDPAKMLADFFYNTEQDLSTEHKLAVLDAFTQHRDWDKTFIQRFWAVADLVAVEWIVRRLQVVVPAEQYRLMLADPNVNLDKLIEERLEEAMTLRADYTPMERLCKRIQLVEDVSGLG